MCPESLRIIQSRELLNCLEKAGLEALIRNIQAISVAHVDADIARSRKRVRFSDNQSRRIRGRVRPGAVEDV
jgi:hypothetical protein